MDLIDILGFFLIVGIYFISAIRPSTLVKNEETYLLADRNTGFFSLLATLVMTEFNTSTLIAFSSLGFIAGIWSLSLPLVFLLGLGFYALTVAKKWQKLHASSVAQIFRIKYGKIASYLTSISLLFAMAGFSAIYVKSLILIFQPLLPDISIWVLGAMLVSLTLASTLRGGLLTIIRTDTISFLMLLIFLPIMLFFVIQNSNEITILFSSDSIQKGQEILPIEYISSLIILTMFTYILSPWYGQKIFSAKSPKVASSSVFFASILIFLMYGVAVLSTSIIRQSIELSNAQTALPYILDQMLPSGLRGVGYALLFATGATTLSGIWSAMVTMFLGDFFPTASQNSFHRSLYLTIAFALLSLILGVTLVDNILNKLILANIPIFALSFALLAGFYWDRVSSIGALVSVNLGLVWGIFCYFYFGEKGLYTWYWTVYGLPIIFGSGVIFSLLFPNKNTKTHSFT